MYPARSRASCRSAHQIPPFQRPHGFLFALDRLARVLGYVFVLGHRNFRAGKIRYDRPKISAELCSVGRMLVMSLQTP